MGRSKVYDLESYVSVEQDNVSKCLLCDKVLKTHMGNIKRHYATVHKKVLSAPDKENIPSTSQPSASKKRKLQTVCLKMDKEEFIKCIGRTVSEMHMPFRYFDNQEFQKLLQPWTDVFGVKYNSKSIGVLLNEMANSLRSEITSIVSKKYLCLKLDIASRMGRSILGVNIQFIDKNFEIVIYTIGMVELFESHDGPNLKKEVLEILKKFDIKISQIYSNTTDNGANVLKTSKLLQECSENYIEDDENYEHFDDKVFNDVTEEMSKTMSVVHCAAHTLQLAASDVITKLKKKIENCRNGVKFIRKKMRELNASPVPVLDNTTRWSSTFEMIKSLKASKTWIDSNNSFTVDVDWEFIKKFHDTFKPIADATTMLQYKQLVMGDFYREWLLCEAEVEEISDSNGIAKSLLEALKRRKKMLTENNAFLAALYMDPRFCFKGSPYLSDEQKKTAILHLLTIYNKLKLSGIINDDLTLEGNPDLNSSVRDDVTDRYQKLEIKASANVVRRTEDCSVQETLEKMQYEEKLPFSANILGFWKSKSFKNHQISKIAEVALAVPATQVSVERSFSALPIVMTKNRRNLSSEHLENILLLKLNPKVIEQISM